MHEEYQFTVFDRGVGELTYCGKRELVGPTQVNVFAPGEVHGAECNASWDLRSAYVPVSLVRQVADQLEWRLRGDFYFPNRVIQNDDLRNRFRRLFDAITEPVTQLSAESLFLSCLTFLFERFTDTPNSQKDATKEPKAAQLCREFLESRYSEEVPLETLARLSGVSAFHLIRSFKRRFGVSPHAFQIALRLNSAKTALQNGATPTEAAMASGFFDQSHLHRYFRRTFGVTPHKYRQMVSTR